MWMMFPFLRVHARVWSLCEGKLLDETTEEIRNANSNNI